MWLELDTRRAGGLKVLSLVECFGSCSRLRVGPACLAGAAAPAEQHPEHIGQLQKLLPAVILPATASGMQIDVQVLFAIAIWLCVVQNICDSVGHFWHACLQAVRGLHTDVVAISLLTKLYISTCASHHTIGHRARERVAAICAPAAHHLPSRDELKRVHTYCGSTLKAASSTPACPPACLYTVGPPRAPPKPSGPPLRAAVPVSLHTAPPQAPRYQTCINLPTAWTPSSCRQRTLTARGRTAVKCIAQHATNRSDGPTNWTGPFHRAEPRVAPRRIAHNRHPHTHDIGYTLHKPERNDTTPPLLHGSTRQTAFGAAAT